MIYDIKSRAKQYMKDVHNSNPEAKVVNVKAKWPSAHYMHRGQIRTTSMQS